MFTLLLKKLFALPCVHNFVSIVLLLKGIIRKGKQRGRGNT